MSYDLKRIISQVELQLKLIKKAKTDLTNASEKDEVISETSSSIQERMASDLDSDPSLEEDEGFESLREVLENECPSLYYELGQMAVELGELEDKYIQFHTFLTDLQLPDT